MRVSLSYVNSWLYNEFTQKNANLQILTGLFSGFQHGSPLLVPRLQDSQRTGIGRTQGGIDDLEIGSGPEQPLCGEGFELGPHDGLRDGEPRGIELHAALAAEPCETVENGIRGGIPCVEGFESGVETRQTVA